MQRKNYILKYKKSKPAMAMIMAIAVIVVVSGIIALSLSMTAQTTKRTTDLYLYEQAQLLSKSATEYALLKIAHDNNLTKTPPEPCNYLNESFVQDNIYEIDISVRYIYESTLATQAINDGTCDDEDIYATVTTPEQSGSALIDVTVCIGCNDNNGDGEADETITTEPIRFFRRTIQKL
jgi:hypothetical protein